MMDNYSVAQMIEDLSRKWNYKKLPAELSEYYREIYKEEFPKWISDNKYVNLYSKNGILITRGYNRIVIGDYGAYIEFHQYQSNHNQFIIPNNQMYRFDQFHKDSIKYIWMSTIHEDCKIYLQTRRVSYADYIPGMFYISPYEVYPKEGV